MTILLSSIRRAIEAARRLRAERRDARRAHDTHMALRDLNTHILRDLGLDRGEIERHRLR